MAMGNMGVFQQFLQHFSAKYDWNCSSLAASRGSPAKHSAVRGDMLDKEDSAHILQDFQASHQILMEVDKTICISEPRSQLFLIYNTM